MAMRRVVLAANGPVRSPKTWSNVPTCLYNALKERQIQVIAVNLAPSRFLKALYLLWTLRRRRSHPGSTYDYFRSALHRIHVQLRLGLVALVMSTDVPFFILSFSFPVTTSRRRVALISDWTYKHYITSHLGRQPDALESKAIVAEWRALLKADLCVDFSCFCSTSCPIDSGCQCSPSRPWCQSADFRECFQSTTSGLPTSFVCWWSTLCNRIDAAARCISYLDCRGIHVPCP